MPGALDRLRAIGTFVTIPLITAAATQSPRSSLRSRNAATRVWIRAAISIGPTPRSSSSTPRSSLRRDPGHGCGKPGEPAHRARWRQATNGSILTAKGSPASSPSRPARGSTSAISPISNAGRIRPARTRRAPNLRWPRLPLAAPAVLDLAGDGQLDLVDSAALRPAFTSARRRGLGAVQALSPRSPTSPWDDPNLTLRGPQRRRPCRRADQRRRGFIWYPSLAEEGFGPAVASTAAGRRKRPAPGLRRRHTDHLSRRHVAATA